MGMDLWFEERISKKKFNDDEIAFWRNRGDIKALVEVVTGETVENEEHKEIPLNMKQMLELQGSLLADMNDEGPTDSDTFSNQLYDLQQIAKCLAFLGDTRVYLVQCFVVRVLFNSSVPAAFAISDANENDIIDKDILRMVVEGFEQLSPGLLELVEELEEMHDGQPIEFGQSNQLKMEREQAMYFKLKYGDLIVNIAD